MWSSSDGCNEAPAKSWLARLVQASMLPHPPTAGVGGLAFLRQLPIVPVLEAGALQASA